MRASACIPPTYAPARVCPHHPRRLPRMRPPSNVPPLALPASRPRLRRATHTRGAAWRAALRERLVACATWSRGEWSTFDLAERIERAQVPGSVQRADVKALLLVPCRHLPLQHLCNLTSAWGTDRLRWHLDMVPCLPPLSPSLPSVRDKSACRGSGMGGLVVWWRGISEYAWAHGHLDFIRLFVARH